MTQVRKRRDELTTQWLRTFLEVASSGSFSAAAARLFVSQSAVSKQIRAIEDYFGTRLVERGRFRETVALTAAGRVLQDRALDLNRTLSDTRTLLREVTEGTKGILRIGASRTPGIYVLPRLLGLFADDRPGLSISLKLGNSSRVEAMVMADEVDMGFIGRPTGVEELVGTPCVEDRLYAVRCARRRHRCGFILRERGSSTREIVERWAAQTGVKMNVTMEVEDMECIKRLMCAGLGMSVLSRFAVEAELRSRRLRIVRLRGLPLRRSICCVLHRRKHVSRAMEDFRRFVTASH